MNSQECTSGRHQSKNSSITVMNITQEPAKSRGITCKVRDNSYLESKTNENTNRHGTNPQKKSKGHGHGQANCKGKPHGNPEMVKLRIQCYEDAIVGNKPPRRFNILVHRRADEAMLQAACFDHGEVKRFEFHGQSMNSTQTLEDFECRNGNTVLAFLKN